MAETRDAVKICLDCLFVYTDIEETEGYGRITLRWMLRKYVVRTGGGLIWLA
jgi:hypothetical protein